jgi:hypothetical protein
MKTITINLSDNLYENLQQCAARTGRTARTILLTWISREIRPVRRNTSSRFESHFGSWNSRNPHGADNEKIETDLQRAVQGDA